MKTWPLIMIAAMAAVSCSVKAPEVTITGEKTALENQVIGEYNNMANETWALGSTRAAGGAQKVKPVSLEKKRVLDAFQQRKFIKDEVDEYLRDGALGEDNRGSLVLRPLPRLDQDAQYKKRVTEVMEQENSSREIIMRRIFAINEDASKAGLDEVYGIFGKKNRAEAPKGSWVQLPSGEWTRKQ